MAWLRIDDAFDAHPKILALGTDQRRYTWLRILVYTCRYRSATIPPNITHQIPKATARFLNDCVDLGLADVDSSGVYVVHDWADYQAGNPKTAARQRRWRNADVDGRVDADVDGHVDASRAGARAFPSRPVLKEQEHSLTQTSSTDAASPSLPDLNTILKDVI